MNFKKTFIIFTTGVCIITPYLFYYNGEVKLEFAILWSMGWVAAAILQPWEKIK